MTKEENYVKNKIQRIESIAMAARECSDIKNPIDIADALGYDIVLTQLTKKVPAFADSSTGTIYISNEVDKYSQQILCAHELGHLLLDNCDSVSLFDETIDCVSEFEANIFAFYLYPKAFVRLDFEENDTIGKFNRFVAGQIHYIC